MECKKEKRKKEKRKQKHLARELNFLYHKPVLLTAICNSNCFIGKRSLKKVRNEKKLTFISNFTISNNKR